MQPQMRNLHTVEALRLTPEEIRAQQAQQQLAMQQAQAQAQHNNLARIYREGIGATAAGDQIAIEVAAQAAAVDKAAVDKAAVEIVLAVRVVMARAVRFN